MSVWELTNITARFVLPPGGLILLGLLGLAIAYAAPRFGRAVAALALTGLYALSTPYLAGALLRSLETPYVDPAQHQGGEAIVVLGGGSYVRAPEYGGDTVGWATLERLRYAAHLQKTLDRPVLVTGGNPTGAATSEAEQMAAVLGELARPPRWIEDRSSNTLESARFSAQLLREGRVSSVYLVTHAWHMPRARLAFEHEGLHVIPAGTRYKPARPLKALDFVPSTYALADSWHYFHEIAGLAWYRLQLRSGRRAPL
jgi:uncharacterized SAM-binding protein YcdF (DUF218 family)